MNLVSNIQEKAQTILQKKSVHMASSKILVGQAHNKKESQVFILLQGKNKGNDTNKSPYLL